MSNRIMLKLLSAFELMLWLIIEMDTIAYSMEIVSQFDDNVSY